MPYYNFINNRTKKEWTEIMSDSERVIYLEKNSHIKQTIGGITYIHDNTRIGINAKPDDGFRDVLRTIKKNNYDSNINTF